MKSNPKHPKQSFMSHAKRNIRRAIYFLENRKPIQSSMVAEMLNNKDTKGFFELVLKEPERIEKDSFEFKNEVYKIRSIDTEVVTTPFEPELESIDEP